MPESVSVPAPDLVKPPLLAGTEPDMVRLLPLAATSIALWVASTSVKARSVAAVTPVNCKVPPASTRLEAAALARPRLPATPPLPMVATESVPALIRVGPV